MRVKHEQVEQDLVVNRHDSLRGDVEEGAKHVVGGSVCQSEQKQKHSALVRKHSADPGGWTTKIAEVDKLWLPNLDQSSHVLVAPEQWLAEPVGGVRDLERNTRITFISTTIWIWIFFIGIRIPFIVRFIWI